MSKHTPEPWHRDGGVRIEADGYTIIRGELPPPHKCDFDGKVGYAMAEANLARVEMSVHAMSGIASAAPGSVAKLVEAAKIIDAMPVDGCSPMVVESMLRQAKTLMWNALAAITVEGGG